MTKAERDSALRNRAGKTGGRSRAVPAEVQRIGRNVVVSGDDPFHTMKRLSIAHGTRRTKSLQRQMLGGSSNFTLSGHPAAELDAS